MSQINLSKRGFLSASLLLSAAPILQGCDAFAKAEAKKVKTKELYINYPEFASLEKEHGGRLGVYILNTETQKSFGHRKDERFAMCSTFKLFLAAVILQDVDKGKLTLEQEIPIKDTGLRFYSDTAEKAAKKGKISIYDALQAIIVNSDNATTNALLPYVDGPSGFTKRMNAIGDNVTNLTLDEPGMSLVLPNTIENTTSPFAFANDIQKIIEPNFLSEKSRKQLLKWMIECETGQSRIIAGLPKDWIFGHKTGTGHDEKMANQYNDIGIIWPKNKPAYIISCFYQADKYYDEMRAIDEMVLQKTGEIARKIIQEA